MASKTPEKAPPTRGENSEENARSGSGTPSKGAYEGASEKNARGAETPPEVGQTGGGTPEKTAEAVSAAGTPRSFGAKSQRLGLADENLPDASESHIPNQIWQRDNPENKLKTHHDRLATIASPLKPTLVEQSMKAILQGRSDVQRCGGTQQAIAAEGSKARDQSFHKALFADGEYPPSTAPAAEVACEGQRRLTSEQGRPGTPACRVSANGERSRKRPPPVV